MTPQTLLKKFNKAKTNGERWAIFPWYLKWLSVFDFLASIRGE